MATRNHPGPNAAAGDRELAAVARQIIDANRYLVLGTADQHGVAWVSPVCYAHAGYASSCGCQIRRPGTRAASRRGRR